MYSLKNFYNLSTKISLSRNSLLAHMHNPFGGNQRAYNRKSNNSSSNLKAQLNFAWKRTHKHNPKNIKGAYNVLYGAVAHVLLQVLSNFVRHCRNMHWSGILSTSMWILESANHTSQSHLNPYNYFYTTLLLFLIRLSFCLSTEAFWWKMASAASSGNRGRCNALCWWLGNWKLAPGTPCWHFYQWKDTSWEICQKRNNCSCKCTSYSIIISVMVCKMSLRQLIF